MGACCSGRIVDSHLGKLTSQYFDDSEVNHILQFTHKIETEHKMAVICQYIDRQNRWLTPTQLAQILDKVPCDSRLQATVRLLKHVKSSDLCVYDASQIERLFYGTRYYPMVKEILDAKMVKSK